MTLFHVSYYCRLLQIIIMCYYIIITLPSHYYCIIITKLLHHYYVYYYYIIITFFYALLHGLSLCILTNHCSYYYTIITSLLQMGNDVVMIIKCYAKGMPLLLHHYLVLLCHYYTGFYCNPLSPISVSRTCR